MGIYRSSAHFVACSAHNILERLALVCSVRNELGSMQYMQKERHLAINTCKHGSCQWQRSGILRACSALICT